MEKLLTENKTLQCDKRLHKNPYLLVPGYYQSYYI